MPKTNSGGLHNGRVLLTRPCHKNHSLAQLLAQHGFATKSCPLIEVMPLADNLLVDKLHRCDIVIAVSANAVLSASEQIDCWPAREYIAVGQATNEAFSENQLSAIVPHEATTEGMLELPLLMQPKEKNILILRGVGGRETLAQQLSDRGAAVVYSELYQREHVVQAKNVVQQWQQQGITTIVVTSAEILHIFVELVNNGYQSWLTDITIIVPSTRVATIANELGAANVEVAQGADNQAILDKLINLQSSFYEK